MVELVEYLLLDSEADISSDQTLFKDEQTLVRKSWTVLAYI